MFPNVNVVYGSKIEDNLKNYFFLKKYSRDIEKQVLHSFSYITYLSKSPLSKKFQEIHIRKTSAQYALHSNIKKVRSFKNDFKSVQFCIRVSNIEAE